MREKIWIEPSGALLFYYNRLKDWQKSCYRKLVEAFRKKDTIVILDNYVNDGTFYDVREAIKYDHPELFYAKVNSPHGVFFLLIETWSVTISYMAEDYVNAVQREIERVLRLSKQEKLLTEYDKCKWAHNYLVKNTTYDDAAKGNSEAYPEAHRVDGVFMKRRSVCDGISQVFKLLCDSLHVKCIVVTGPAGKEKENQGLHAWNIVQIAGRNSHVDVTWDMCASISKRYTVYDYFCIPDKWIGADHSFSGYPVCETEEYSFFYKKQKLFSGVRSLKAYLEKEITGKDTTLYFRITGSDIPNDIEDRVTKLVQKYCIRYSGNYLSYWYDDSQRSFFYRIKRRRG